MTTGSAIERVLQETVRRLKDADPDVLREEIRIVPLGVKDSIGSPKPFTDFALQQGEERLVEATFRDKRGQAFTGFPDSWSGRLEDLLRLPLEESRTRAFFTAGLNAAGRALGWGSGTVHCRDDAPGKCGKKFGACLAEAQERPGNVVIVGYQPALLQGISGALGPDRVRATDLNPKNIGRIVSGVTILDGEKDIEQAAVWADTTFITGSTLVNGTIDGLLDAFCGKRTVFFGTTIAIPASLMGWERWCFESA